MVTVSYTRRPAIRADRDCTFVAGDADMVFGEKFGRLIYFENLGSTLSPVFVQKSGDDNPFDGIDVGSFSEPALADLDNDGDLDLVAGDGDGMLHFLENTGTSTAPVFVQRTGSENPFDGVSSYSKPALADLDNDGMAPPPCAATVITNKKLYTSVVTPGLQRECGPSNCSPRPALPAPARPSRA